MNKLFFIRIAMSFFLTIRVLTVFSQTQLGSDIFGDTVKDAFSHSISSSRNGRTIAVGIPLNIPTVQKGMVRLFKYVNSSWQKLGQDLIGDNMNDRMGWGVSMADDGNTVAISSYTASPSGASQRGLVRVYGMVAGSWKQIGADLYGTSNDEWSGWSIQLSATGKRLIVGSQLFSDSGNRRGRVRVFEFSSGTWNQLGSPIIGKSDFSYFGYSTSISADGNTIAIGAPWESNGGFNGVVRIYKWVSGKWALQGSMIGPTTVAQYSGWSTSLNTDGTVVAIGAPNSASGSTISDNGATRIFAFNGTNWVQRGSDIIGENKFDYSGYSVSLHGNGKRLVIGAEKNAGAGGTERGHARIFNYIGSNWVQYGSDIDGVVDGDKLGARTHISGNGNVVLVATSYAIRGKRQGFVKVFEITPCSFKRNTVNKSICTNELPYTWNGKIFTKAKTDSVLLESYLGCDSMVILNLKVNNQSKSVSTISACSGDLPYSWNGKTLSSAKIDTVVLMNYLGCDSLTIIHFSIRQNSDSTLKLSICKNNAPFLFNGKNYSQSVIDTLVLSNYLGCDSTIILQLLVHATSSSVTNHKICNNKLPYTWNGKIYSVAQTDTVRLINYLYCDSLAILKLETIPNLESLTKITICESVLPFIWNGIIFNSAKTDTAILISKEGCDSLAILNLEIKKTSSSITSIKKCKKELPFVWNGKAVSAEGSTSVILTNSLNCDSLATLITNVVDSSSSSSYISACGSYNWQGINYESSGIYYKTIPNFNGCDSVLKLNLVVTITNLEAKFVVATQLLHKWPVHLVNISDSETDSMHWIIPNSALFNINNRTNNLLELEFHDSGTFRFGIETYKGSCYKIMEKEVFVMLRDTTKFSSQIRFPFIKKFQITPNPSTGIFNIKVHLNEQSAIRLRILNTKNMVIHDRKESNKKLYELPYELTLQPGIYIVHLETPNENLITKIIIQ